MKFKNLFMSVAIIATLLTISCSTDEVTTTTTATTATVTAITCSAATFSATATASSAYTGTATVPYTGGNGVAYAAGSAIASTGVTGLTATLTAATLASGAGNATFAITGTPSATGTAAFAIAVGGQSCNLSLTVAAATTTTPISGSAWSIDANVASVVTLADAFKASLTATQVTALQDASYNKAHAQKWSNFPLQGYKDRVGLQTNSLSATQWTSFLNLLKAVTGTGKAEGYSEYMGILAADDYLFNVSGETFGSGYYFIAYIGVPSATGQWCLQVGGHHGTIIYTYNGGKMTGGTPSFRSTEPYPTWTLKDVFYNPMVQETAAFSKLLTGLSASELAIAKRAAAQNDIIAGPQKDANFPATKTGIKGSSLSATQKDLLLLAIKTYVDDLDDKAAAQVLAKYKSELDDTYVSYVGGTTMAAQGDYILIDGPGVWIEWSIQSSRTIAGSVHPHSVWRDRKSDYGSN